MYIVYNINDFFTSSCCPNYRRYHVLNSILGEIKYLNIGVKLSATICLPKQKSPVLLLKPF